MSGPFTENGIISDQSINGSLGTANTPFIAANKNRQFLFIGNPNAVAISVRPVGSTVYWNIAAGGSLQFSSGKIAGNAFEGLAASGTTNNVVIWEM